jgi:hypothetical protein
MDQHTCRCQQPRGPRRRGGPRWPGLRRPAALAGGLAATALLAAACGGGSVPTSNAETAYQKTLAYSQCMRTHGIPDMPDPQVNDQGVQIRIGGPGHSGPAPNSPVLRAAQQACQKLMPGGPP